MNEEQKNEAAEIQKLALRLNSAIGRAARVDLRAIASIEERRIAGLPDIVHLEISLESEKAPTLAEALEEVGFRPFGRSRGLVRERRSREPLKR
ncbi:hypothetical protein [Rhizobium sp. BK376]|uniref:hypothetical protein n=1 Tax=Rhizobium sp. BK376 TaxID=2512149 RepID=UPI001042F9D1|nr:hypothetical protein [Rhizobium sp. BK376]